MGQLGINSDCRSSDRRILGKAMVLRGTDPLTSKMTLISKSERPGARDEKLISVEHPIGETSVVLHFDIRDNVLVVKKVAILRTARKLFESQIF